MPYIGNPIYQSAFVVDQFSGNGSTTAFTMSVAPAGVTNVLVAVSGVLQDPSTYGVVGNTLTFTAAPPSGTGNISCRYLGVPASGVTTTAYRTVTEFTATASQTTFTPPSYTVGFINVYLNGVLLGSADYTATNGTTVVLTTGALAGNLVTVESFLVSSVLNAIPNTAGSVSSSNIQTSVALTTPTMTSPTISSGALTIGTTSLGAGNASSFKNRIINGAMVIDQRNAGASVTATTSGPYTLDRWYAQATVNSKYTVQQNAGAVTPPVGFSNYLGATSSAATVLAAGDYYCISQGIEGFNIADLAWGTANAKTVTLSFQVYSSQTGTFGGSLWTGNSGAYLPFSYSIPTANTWANISVTIAGPTIGSWYTNSSNGVTLNFSLGAGTTYSGGTAGTWSSTLYVQPSGCVNLITFSGATFYITGVQLEVGSTATSFDYRDYGRELILCQRYYFKVLPGATTTLTSTGYNANTTLFAGFIQFPVTMRTAPTSLEQTGTATDYQTVGSYGAITCSAVPTFNDATVNLARTHFTVASGLTAGQAGVSRAATSNGFLAWSAEL